MKALTLLLALCLPVAADALGAVYVVNPEGTGDFAVVQDAIEAASEGDVIELTDGTFRGEGNRDLDFLGKAITVRSQSGDPRVCLLDCQGSYAEPHRGLTFHSGEDTTSAVAGLTITMGVGHVGEGGDHYGGGIHCDGSSPAIRNCILDRNYATMGGGVYCTGECSVVFSGCIFRNNSGSGVVSRYGPTPHFRDCSFIENWSNSKGAGLCTRESVVVLDRCSFVGNVTAADGGGAFLWFSGATLTDCVFDSNEALWWGGGLNADSEQPPVLTRCVFVGNRAYHGGGIHLEWCPAILTDCACRENVADAGGGIYTINGLPILTGCTVEDNTAQVGGGVACCGSPTFTNCTISGNCAPDAAGIYCWRDQLYGWANPVFANALIAFNSPGQGLLCAHEPTITLTCCDIYGNAGGDWTGLIADQLGVNGNIWADPLFCDDQNPEEPLTVHALSPCAAENNPACGQIGAWPVACGWEAVDGGCPDHSTGLWLGVCRPNPMRGQAGLDYRIPPELEASVVRLSVIDSAGRLVRTLLHGRIQAGIHYLAWRGNDGSNRQVPAGVYFAELRVGSERLRRRIVLLE
jgi:hypothetical protein